LLAGLDSPSIRHVTPTVACCVLWQSVSICQQPLEIYSAQLANSATLSFTLRHVVGRAGWTVEDQSRRFFWVGGSNSSIQKGVRKHFLFPHLGYASICFVHGTHCTYVLIWWGNILRSIDIFFIIIISGVRLSPLGTAATIGLLYQSIDIVFIWADILNMWIISSYFTSIACYRLFIIHSNADWEAILCVTSKHSLWTKYIGLDIRIYERNKHIFHSILPKSTALNAYVE
jgi:hypothetical protein